MIKKSVLGLFVFIGGMWVGLATAQQDGQVILDLQDDRDNTGLVTQTGVPGMIEMGLHYWEDVKKYHEQLKGSPLKTNINPDIQADHESFTPEQAEAWGKAVKKGVKWYRFYEDVKAKAVSWIMNQEMPLVVADDQYEMGEAEEYIESDKPVIVKRFKKVVAYSNQERDKKAAEEKYAKEHNLRRPSEVIKMYQKALVNRDWKTLFDFDWKTYLKEISDKRKVASLPAQGLNAAILSEFDGVPKDGKIIGVVVAEPRDQQIVLLSDYEDYKGLKVDFSKSENLTDAQASFVLPQQIVTSQGFPIFVYAAKFPIYFSGKAIDETKPVIVRAVLEAQLCRDMTCRAVKANATVTLEPRLEARETSFATYIRTVGQNVPHEVNKDIFKFRNLFVEKGQNGEPDKLRLELETKKSPLFKVFIADEKSRYLGPAVLRIDGEEVTATFTVLDKNLDLKGKEFVFWCLAGGADQYLHKMTVQDTRKSYFDEKGVSLKIFALALLGGLLLNLMPCVFPVLSLKILAFTKFGGLNTKVIRRNFFYNSLGIGVAFVLAAGLLSGLKMLGYSLGWGMQFQNVYFLSAIVWVVVLFLAHVLGFINLRTPAFSGKLLDKTRKDGRLFEFLSGVFLVLLSTPCMAPYLGTAFGVALAGSVADILLVVTAVGLGLALPYLLIAAVPEMALYMPKPGKWMNTLNVLMFVLLVVTICWLVSVLAAQTAANQLWHWALYVLGGLVVLFFHGVFTQEIGKLEQRDIAKILQRRMNYIFGSVLLVLIGVSMFDAGRAIEKRQNFVQQTKLSKVDLSDIQNEVRLGGKVLVKIGADWCLTCKYNDAFVFDVEHINDTMQRYNVRVVDIDWTRYEPQVLEFMQKFGRYGLPFYVLFSPAFPDGIMLSEMPSAQDLQTLVEM